MRRCTSTTATSGAATRSRKSGRSRTHRSRLTGAVRGWRKLSASATTRRSMRAGCRDAEPQLQRHGRGGVGLLLVAVGGRCRYRGAAERVVGERVRRPVPTSGGGFVSDNGDAPQQQPQQGNAAGLRLGPLPKRWSVEQV